MKIITTTAVLMTLCLLITRPCSAQTSTGNTNPGTVTDVALGGSSFNWNSPGSAAVVDGSSASTAQLLSVNTGTTEYLQFTNFGFNIPTGSTINGITVNITRKASGLTLVIGIFSLTGSVNDNIVQLTGPGVTSVNKASGLGWSTSSATATYGSSSDVWGPTVWTAAMVNSSAFGVNVSSALNGGNLLGIDLIPGASIDGVTINVTYSLPVTLALHLDQWSATPQGSGCLLQWQAASDGTPAEFIVERSGDGQAWVSLSKQPALSGDQRYAYTDEKPLAGGPTYYRLRFHSADQGDSWSTVQVLSPRTSHPLINMYPNPFYNMINISAASPFTRLVLTNAQGERLWVKEFPGGMNATQIPAFGLPQGLYFVTVDGATYSVFKGQ